MRKKIVSTDGWWALEPMSGGTFHILRKALRDEDDDWIVMAGVHIDQLVVALAERRHILADTLNMVANVKDGLACEWCGLPHGDHHELCGRGSE